MSRLSKRPTFRYTPPVPGTPTLAAGVQCPPPGVNRTYVVRNGSYVLSYVAPAGTGPRPPGNLRGLCIQRYTPNDGSPPFYGPCVNTGIGGNLPPLFGGG